MYQPIEQGAAVVAESRAGVRVDLELVFTPRILQRADTGREESLFTAILQEAKLAFSRLIILTTTDQ